MKTFEKHPNIIITSLTDHYDNKSEQRSRLFSRWIDLYCPDYIEIRALEFEIKNSIVTAYLFFNSNNPYTEDIERAFYEYYINNYS